ncbi:MAG: helix-turn-helix domain-containing protein [Clostridia bacterium]|nr:helix-turn-helix domain-containing protein [Clostridia bacterium]
MKQIPFNELFHTDFFISETIVKAQNWYDRQNVYSCIGKPKPSHTLLWFKNCRGKITDKSGNVLEVGLNQMTYMSKDIEYTVDFYDTAPDRADTFVLHFQLKDASGEDIAPAFSPVLCITDVDISMAMAIESTAEECKKNIACLPLINSEIYRIFAFICKKAHKGIIKTRYAYIRRGIDLLENDSDLSMEEIAHICGVSEGYFRRLFKEYSGYNPMDFRQKHRIEKAKQMLLLDNLSIGEIARELHFSDIYHFSKAFKKTVGVSPSEYRAGISV